MSHAIARADDSSSDDEEQQPMSLHDNPDIEFLPPNIPIESLAACISDEREAIGKRMRTVFLLKQFKNHAAIDALQAGMTSESVLLKHEIAYALGQLQDTYAVPFLEQTLSDPEQHPIVRHECAESLAAIGLPSSLDLLARFAVDADAPVEVRETCQLSLDMIAWRKAHPQPVRSKYMSVDPAPPFPKKEVKTVAQLEAILLDTQRSMFDRYRAMFALRNRDSEEAVAALAKGFADGSALFKHEIAFVFGQMQHKASIPALRAALETEGEHAMVRHEAAEALGSVSATHGCEEAALPTLQRFVVGEGASAGACVGAASVRAKEDEAIVRESCEVALDIHEYWSDEHNFGGLDQFEGATVSAQ